MNLGQSYWDWLPKLKVRDRAFRSDDHGKALREVDGAPAAYPDYGTDSGIRKFKANARDIIASWLACGASDNVDGPRSETGCKFLKYRFGAILWSNNQNSTTRKRREQTANATVQGGQHAAILVLPGPRCPVTGCWECATGCHRTSAASMLASSSWGEFRIMM